MCAGVRKLATRLLVGESRRRVRGPNAQTGSDRPAYVMPPLGPGDVYDAETAARVCFQREALEGTAPTTMVKQLVSSGKVAASISALNQRLIRFRNQAAQLGWNKALANVAPFGRSGRPSLNPRSKANAWRRRRLARATNPNSGARVDRQLCWRGMKRRRREKEKGGSNDKTCKSYGGGGGEEERFQNEAHPLH